MVKNKKQKTNNKGFTLIETMVAVLLLASAITGPLLIASKGLSAALVAKDQITAFYLAQDAVEQVRYLRDSACLAGTGGPSGCATDVWLSSLGACKSTDGSATCELDSLGFYPSAPTICAGGVCDTLYYDTGSHSFNYNVSAALTPQRYVRTISIQNDPLGTTPDEAVVTVRVTWNDIAGVTHAPIIVRENIFRWQ